MPDIHISPSVHINYTIHHPSNDPPTTLPWVILVNGLADAQTTWAAQTPAFTDAGYTVLTYDNRGVGLSSRAQADGELWTAEVMAQDLRSLVEALDVPRPYHLLGVSMGGMIAQRYALDYANTDAELASVTFACTYAAPGPFCSRMFALWRDMAQQMSVADAMRDVTLWCFSEHFFADPARQDDLAAMEEDMKRIDDDAAMGLRSYLAQLNVITTFDTRREIGKLAADATRAKVIVLAGERDVLIPVSLSQELHSLVPGSVWRTTKGGHSANWEFPVLFNQTCLEAWKEAEKGLLS